MARNFAASVDNWVAKSKDRTERVFKQAMQDTFLEANKDKSHGGLMPVDTGFLRASFKVEQETIPSGGSKGDRHGSYGEPDIALSIARMRVGGTIYAGWTAEYASIRESKDGFMESAAQKWQQFVNEAARKVKQR